MYYDAHLGDAGQGHVGHKLYLCVGVDVALEAGLEHHHLYPGGEAAQGLLLDAEQRQAPAVRVKTGLSQPSPVRGARLQLANNLRSKTKSFSREEATLKVLNSILNSMRV